jgi:hypothetical protein
MGEQSRRAAIINYGILINGVADFRFWSQPRRLVGSALFAEHDDPDSDH